MTRERRPPGGDDEGRRPPRRAAAVRYDPHTDAAPRIVAAGEGNVAEAIIEEARRHGVPLYRDPYLAEALVKLPVGTEIPPRLYVAIARVLAFVYQLDQQKRRSREGDRQPRPRTGARERPAETSSREDGREP